MISSSSFVSINVANGSCATNSKRMRNALPPQKLRQLDEMILRGFSKVNNNDHSP